MPKHEIPTYVDAEAMTPEERLDRLAEILARGVLRLIEEKSRACAGRPKAGGRDRHAPTKENTEAP